MNRKAYAAFTVNTLKLMHEVDAIYIEKLEDGKWQAQVLHDCMPTSWWEDWDLLHAVESACEEALQ